MSWQRKTELVTNSIYHVFNRGIDKRTTFSDKHEFLRAYQILKYYRYSLPPVKLSRFLLLGDSSRNSLMEENWGVKLVSIKTFCLMPNHFHLLLEQLVDNGISKYLSQIQNSYTRYFNIKNKRVGQLFLDNFKNVLVNDESQLLHLSRYIHLNPYTAGVVKDYGQLCNYEWSSIKEYIGGSDDNLCDKEMISSYFNSMQKYKNFVLDNAEYQRELKNIEHQLLE